MSAAGKWFVRHRTAGEKLIPPSDWNLGRRFVGVEKDPKYFALAVERLRAEEAGSTLSAARAGQLPLLGGSS